MGNLGSIKNMISKIGEESIISSDPKQIIKASKIILPGVGSFDRAIHNINKLGLKEVLNNSVLNKKIPILGICLGMQIMTKASEEGNLAGLGWIRGKCKKFILKKLRVPHMGWNYIKVQCKIPLTEQITDSFKFYFVHSYYVVLDNPDDIMFSTNYGEEFCSAFQRKNIFGVQFHPEKSHKFGLQFLKNFIEK